MSIETTVNMDIHYFEMLESLCEKYSLSRKQLVAMLLHRFLQKKQLVAQTFKRVSYQRRQPKHCWKTVHIFFAEDMFEKCGDVRTFCKFSVSLFIAKAIESYLDMIVRELSGEKYTKKKTDNYHHNYMRICSNEQGIINFHVYWGIPDRKKVEMCMKKE
jgi:hypothetical protein